MHYRVSQKSTRIAINANNFHESYLIRFKFLLDDRGDFGVSYDLERCQNKSTKWSPSTEMKDYIFSRYVTKELLNSPSVLFSHRWRWLLFQVGKIFHLRLIILSFKPSHNTELKGFKSSKCGWHLTEAIRLIHYFENCPTLLVMCTNTSSFRWKQCSKENSTHFSDISWKSSFHIFLSIKTHLNDKECDYFGSNQCLAGVKKVQNCFAIIIRWYATDY